MPHPSPRDQERPLCVDLDGTLICTDLLAEALLSLLKQRPWTLLLLPLWFLRGKAYLKNEVARRVTIDPATLPYREDVLEYLRAECARGRRLILATAAARLYATQMATHIGLFSDVFATDTVNLKGTRKAECLVAIFGTQCFDYMGDSHADLAIVPFAHETLLVAPSASLLGQATAIGRISKVFPAPNRPCTAPMRTLRPHQWLKNLLVFVPPIADHQFGMRTWILALLAFVAFSLTASGLYVLNDLLDLAADRTHPRKKMRPFASGQMKLAHGMLLAPLMVAAGFITALGLPSLFGLTLLFYVALTLGYSFLFKRLMILDVLVLAALYTVRLLGGAAATRIPPSFWLLAFSVFFFLSLALIKRYAELVTLRQHGQVKATGRGYHVDDFPVLLGLGMASGYSATVVLALYLNSPVVASLYRDPRVLWLLCPLLFYWLNRAWLLTHRGEMHDDPVIFAATDRVSLAVWVLSGAVLFWAAI
ncbi:MAG: UbiA family prenyltransferase [Burkholderiales bacterium]